MKRNVRKAAMAAVLGAMMVSGMTVSASSDVSVYDMTKADLEGRKITLTTAEDWWNDTYQGVIDKYSEEFGVEIEVNILPAETASEVIKSQFATGELADITMNSASPAELTYMRASEMLVCMNDEPWVEKLSDTSGFLYTDGNLYGLPLASQDYWGFCANKNVLSACGLEIPTSKEELVQCFDVLKEKGYIPFYSGAGDSWMCGNITSSGIHTEMEADPGLIEKFNTNQYHYSDSESFKAMLQDVSDWAAAGYFGDNFMSQTWDGMQDAVANDECGFNIGLTSWLTTMDTTYGEGTSDKLELIPYYIGENDTIYQSTCCELYVNKKTENLDVCRHLFNWLCEDENLQQLYDGLGSASIFKNIVSEGMCDSTKALMEKISDGTYGLHVSHNSVARGQDWDTFCSMMQEVYMGDMTPDEFCEQYDEFRYSICVALGLEGF
ncbi:MAG: ABC transporter substrate-binding protein [Candidatus Limivivens sp.]|nr:ABC transporter substrate-binding protein [Candidatus Limivivens sp.]